MDNSKTVKKKVHPENKLNKTLALILSAIAFMIYYNTLSHNYALDDFSLISENTVTVKGVKAIPDIFSNFYRYGYYATNDGIYRPLSVAMFALEWTLSPNNPQLSHFINVLFYVLTTLVLFVTLTRLLKNYTLVLPVIITLLFITHPIHTEVVANIKSRDELCCFLCSFITLYYLLEYVEFQSEKKLGLALLFFFVAFLSKETAITMVLVIPVTLLFFTEIKRQAFIKTTAGLCLVAITFLAIRANVLDDGKSTGVTAVENLLLLAPTKMEQLATAIKILGHYLALLFYPDNLLYDRSVNQIPIINFSNPGALLSLLIYAGMFIYAIWSCLKKDLLAFGILFYLLTLSLFSNVVFIIGAAMADRFAYFASFGFCFSLAVILMGVTSTLTLPVRYANLNDLFNKNKTIFSIVIIISCLYSFKTLSRNTNWKDNYTLFKHDIKYAPDNARAHFFLGTEVIRTIAPKESDPGIRMALYNEGIEELRTSLQIYADNPDALNSLAAGYFQINSMDSAEYYFTKALSYNPTDLTKLGDFYMAKSDYNKAIEVLKKSIMSKPKNLDTYVNLGICYGTLKNYKESIFYFSRALALQPHNARLNYFLAVAYKANGDLTNYERYYRQARQIDPNSVMN